MAKNNNVRLNYEQRPYDAAPMDWKDKIVLIVCSAGTVFFVGLEIYEHYF